MHLWHIFNRHWYNKHRGYDVSRGDFLDECAALSLKWLVWKYYKKHICVWITIFQLHIITKYCAKDLIMSLKHTKININSLTTSLYSNTLITTNASVKNINYKSRIFFSTLTKGTFTNILIDKTLWGNCTHVTYTSKIHCSLTYEKWKRKWIAHKIINVKQPSHFFFYPPL